MCPMPHTPTLSYELTPLIFLTMATDGIDVMVISSFLYTCYYHGNLVRYYILALSCSPSLNGTFSLAFKGATNTDVNGFFFTFPYTTFNSKCHVSISLLTRAICASNCL